MNKVIIFFFKKYIFSTRREWLRFDSIFMVIGIIISVATLTVAHSIFEGYETVLKKTILSVNSHVYVFLSKEGNLEDNNIEELSEFLSSQIEVESFSPVIISQIMASNNGRVKGALMRGIQWEKEDLPSAYKKYVFAGDYKLESDSDVVIGYKLAKELNLKLGDVIQLVSPMNSKVTALGMQSAKEDFTIKGLYKSGMHEYDSKYIFLNLDSAAAFNNFENEFTMMEIKLKPDFIESADYLAYKWQMILNYKYQISSWIDFNGNLFSLLKLEKWVIFIILSFLILIASFNVVSSVSTSIIEKKRELGILKAYGASNMFLARIFIGKTLIISFIAVLFGQLLGLGIAKFISWQTFFLLKGDVYFLEKINVRFSFISWLIILGTSLLIVFLSSLIPLKKISQMEVTEILRG
ncbi:MAG: hypothetical protein DRI23_08830 [Candidatus Cloacimonadota bacterium]|nr:MAG: hypothetical protein DRI23_08830 [Candidatus Cloacimonadota bacterium]